MNDYDSIPIVRLELERMKFQIVTMLSSYTDELNANIQRAVDDYCTDENLHAVVRDAVKTTLNNVIKEQVNRYFTYGAGYRAVERAVKDGLENIVGDAPQT
jgi:hypothetical protein